MLFTANRMTSESRTPSRPASFFTLRTSLTFMRIDTACLRLSTTTRPFSVPFVSRQRLWVVGVFCQKCIDTVLQSFCVVVTYAPPLQTVYPITGTSFQLLRRESDAAELCAGRAYGARRSSRKSSRGRL